MISSVNIILFVVMTLLGAFAGLYLKKASSTVSLIDLLKEHYIYVGGGLYFLSALLNVYLLKYISLSIILPLTSVTYIWTMIISNRFLDEKLSFKKIIGIFTIIIGVTILIIGQ